MGPPRDAADDAGVLVQHAPLVATFTSPAALSLFDPGGCNEYRVDVSDTVTALVVG
jgi:hypothetical protein